MNSYAAPVLWSLALLTAQASEQPLFNGKDLDGWDAAPGWWRVEEGALTAESTPEKPCKKCNYLIWKGGEPTDFELTADFKLSANANSGIQIRSARRPEWDTMGYQVDMTGNGSLVGFIYHHKGGLVVARGEQTVFTSDGQKQVKKIAEATELLKAFKKEDWNTCRIVCRGPEISYYLNGVLMSRVTDHRSAIATPSGVIGLQMHPGPPMKVQFKNIVLKTLN